MLLDYWPLGRWQEALSAPIEGRNRLVGKLLWEKLPFILLAIASVIVTFWAQDKGNSIITVESLNFYQRLSNAIFHMWLIWGKFSGRLIWLYFIPINFPCPNGKFWLRSSS